MLDDEKTFGQMVARLLSPGSKDSGETRRHRSENKDGYRYQRITFHQAVIIAYTHFPVLRKFYKKAKRRSRKYVALAEVGKENDWPQPISSNALQRN